MAIESSTFSSLELGDSYETSREATVRCSSSWDPSSVQAVHLLDTAPLVHLTLFYRSACRGAGGRKSSVWRGNGWSPKPCGRHEEPCR